MSHGGSQGETQGQAEPKMGLGVGKRKERRECTSEHGGEGTLTFWGTPLASGSPQLSLWGSNTLEDKLFMWD